MKIPSMPYQTGRLLTAIFLSVVTSQMAFAANGFSKIVVFGDSLNDSGNMVQYTNGYFPSPATNYAYGRQSNGPVWVEYLAARLGLSDQLFNYAVVGAMTKPTANYPTGNVWSPEITGLEGTSVQGQIADYLGDVGGQADPNALYILEGGANDFPRVNPATIVPNILEALVMLETSGAKHIVLADLPDLGKTPRVRAMGEAAMTMVSAGCGQLNAALLYYLPTCTAPGVTITIADFYGFLNTMTYNADTYGLVDVEHAAQTVLVVGENADAWLYWDDYHPTTRAHKLFADRIEKDLLGTYFPGKGQLGKGAINSLNGLVKASRP